MRDGNFVQRSTLPFPRVAGRSGDASAARASRYHAHACVTRILAAIPRTLLVHRPITTLNTETLPSCAVEKKTATLALGGILSLANIKLYEWFGCTVELSRKVYICNVVEGTLFDLDWATIVYST